MTTDLEVWINFWQYMSYVFWLLKEILLFLLYSCICLSFCILYDLYKDKYNFIFWCHIIFWYPEVLNTGSIFYAILWTWVQNIAWHWYFIEFFRTKENRVHDYLNHLMINLFTTINIQSWLAPRMIFVFQQIKLIDQVLEVCMQLKNSWG